MEEMISVIVPVHNMEQFLDRCVQSMRNQTYQGTYEILLVENASTDASPEMCDRYGQQDPDKIRVFHLEKGDLSLARNFGIENARGQYLCFVDSDDYISEDHLEVLFRLLKEYDADVSSMNNRLFYDGYVTGKKAGREKEQIKIYMGPEKVLWGLFYHEIETAPWAKLYKKSVFDGERFTPGRSFEDYASEYRFLAKTAKVVSTSKVGYYYFVNDNSITHTMSDKKIQDYQDGRQEVHAFVTENYPDLLTASYRYHFRMAMVVFPLLCDGSKKSREQYRRMRDLVKPYLGTCLNDAHIPLLFKLRMLSVCCGYTVMRYSYLSARKLKRLAMKKSGGSGGKRQT